MNKGKGYIITLNIILAMFFGGLVNVNTVSAYQHLNIGDQLLYYASYNHYYDENNMMLFENELSEYDSYYDIYHQEFNADEFHSYTVKNDFTSYTEGRRVSNYIDTFRNEYNDHYSYNYDYPSWEYEWGYSNSDLYSSSSTWISSYNNYDGLCNADIPNYFGSAYYLYNEMRGYTINGYYNTYNCSVYYYGYGYSDTYNYTMYNITYEYNSYYYYDAYFYIDQDTGFILEYYESYYANDWANFDQYAEYPDIYCNVSYNYNYYVSNNYNWYLTETSAAYGYAVDADLPAIEWDWGYEYAIYPGLEYLTIYFSLFDSYGSCTIDVYLEGTYLDTINRVPGYQSYDLKVKDLAIMGYDPTLKFVVTDNSGMGHTTTFNIWLNDYRDDYPIINGPDYWDYKIGDTKTLHWELKDYNNDADYYELKFNGTLLLNESWYDGKIIGFNLQDYIFTPGSYEIKIKAVDMMGFTTYKFVTINAYDEIPTTPTEPTGTNTGTDTGTTSGTNTVTLDAPTLLYTILGIIGFLSLTVLIRRRK